MDLHRIGRLLVVCLLLASPVAADGLRLPDKLFIATVPAFSYEAYKDARKTRICVETGECIEVNPLWAAIAQKDGIRRSMQWKLAAQAGLAGGLGYAMHRWPSRKWILYSAFATLTAGQGIVNHHNKRVLENAR